MREYGYVRGFSKRNAVVLSGDGLICYYGGKSTHIIRRVSETEFQIQSRHGGTSKQVTLRGLIHTVGLVDALVISANTKEKGCNVKRMLKGGRNYVYSLLFRHLQY